MRRSRDLALEVILVAAASLGHKPEASVEHAVEAALLGCADRERERVRLALLDARSRLRAWIDDAAWTRGQFARVGAQFSSQIDPLRELSEGGSHSLNPGAPEPSGVHEVPEE